MTNDSPRDDLHVATEAFLALVSAIPDGAWERPALGVWTVRELVGHTGRALTTLEEYLAAPPAPVATTADALAYFRLGRTAGITNSDAVAERGRQAGRDLGTDPSRALHDVAERVLRRVDEAPDDALLTLRLGAMRLVDYLPTRVFELVVHSLDLQAAVDVAWTVPRGPLESALRLATALAVDQGLGPGLLLALTGRRPLPEGFCVL